MVYIIGTSIYILRKRLTTRFPFKVSLVHTGRIQWSDVTKRVSQQKTLDGRLENRLVGLKSTNILNKDLQRHIK